MAKKTEKTETETISVPRGSDREDPNLVISVNGVRYMVPKGKRSEVPPEFAEEFERSERARDAFSRTREQRLKEAKA